jgi:hypothetical protein
MNIKKECANSYAELKHLGLTAKAVGIPWQTVYVYLKEMGVAVTGDKSTYGSPRDKLAAKGEEMFSDLVPFSDNSNEKMYQAKIDFDVLGTGVDVKTSKLKKSHHQYTSQRWAFSLKKQSILADFFVMFALDSDENLTHTLLIPAELVREFQTISVPYSMQSKWASFLIEPQELAPFFKSLTKAKNAA